MKRLSLVIVVLLLAVLVWFAASRSNKTETVTSNPTDQSSAPAAPEEGTTSGKTAVNASSKSEGSAEEADAESEEAEEDDQQARPATEVYHSADEALKAVKEGATDYDDLVLEQFTELGADCSWCDSFYSSLKSTMNDPSTTTEQKSYFAEVLAISGRVDNVQTLVDSIKASKTPEESDIYSEALELTLGKDDVVNFLATQLNSDNQPLKESVVAAITNQGSLLATTVLYKHTTERGDPDGYYSQGTGLGETIPNEEALPFLQDAVVKHDAYSHLAAKAMLNNGVDGLRRLIDVLETSSDPNFDKQMASGLSDHVSYEEESEKLLKDKAENSKSEVVRGLAKQWLADFNVEGEADTEE